MVRYIHSGDEAEDNKKEKQTAGPEGAEQESNPGASEENLGEGNKVAAGKSGEAESADELGLLESQGQTESGGDDNRDTGTKETDEASSGEQTGSEEETTGTLAAIRTGSISAAIVTAAVGSGNAGGKKEEHAKAEEAQTNSKNSGEADNSTANSGGTGAGASEQGGKGQQQSGEESNESGSGENGSGVNSFFNALFGSESENENKNGGTNGRSAGKQDSEAQAEPGGDPQSKGTSAAGDGAAEKKADTGDGAAKKKADAGADGDRDKEDMNSPDESGTSNPQKPGAKQADQPSSDKSSNLEASSAEGESAKANGGGKAAAGGESQDMEASGELGAEEQEGGKKGFFARLFGDDADDMEEDSGSDGEPGTQSQAPQEASAAGGSQQQTHTQPEKPKKNNKQAGQKENEAEQKKDPLQLKRDTERSDSLEQSVIYWQGNDKISSSLEETKNTLTEVMGLGSSYDIVFREMSFGGRKVALVCISGFANDGIIDEILKRLTYLTPEDVSTDVMARFMNEYIPHVQVEKGDLLSESINKVLAGMSVFFIEGETQAIVMDTRSYPSRSPDEPSIERVVRGSRDGFTETLQNNVALVRRRIRDPGLKYEIHQIGRRTRTDVCVAYIDDIVDKTQVKAVTDKIKSVNIDGIPLADKQLEEAIVGAGWNPYPLVRYSERPDVVASHLLEGRLVIFVDTSPSVIVLPTTFFDLCQHAEENRQTPFIGTYLRWVRFIGIFASMFLLPLWMLMVIHPELLPPMLDFIGPQKTAKIPLLAQFLIVELGVDLLRMAAVHTPTPLGSAMGLIAAILVGDIAVQTGLFVNEVVLYMAVASIGMFATPSYELGLANRIVRLVLLVAVAAFQVQGFMIGSTLLIILLTLNRSYNSSYLWPFIPFNAKAMGEIILRQPVLSSKTRPSFNKTRDNTRMAPYQKRKDPS